MRRVPFMRRRNASIPSPLAPAGRYESSELSAAWHRFQEHAIAAFIAEPLLVEVALSAPGRVVAIFTDLRDGLRGLHELLPDFVDELEAHLAAERGGEDLGRWELEPLDEHGPANIPRRNRFRGW